MAFVHWSLRKLVGLSGGQPGPSASAGNGCGRSCTSIGCPPPATRLVEGLTDETIAVRLGIGGRTSVAHLMDALGASGRVALGAEAIRRRGLVER